MVDRRNLEPRLKLFHLRSCLEGEAQASLSDLAEIIQYKIHEKGPTALYKRWARLHQLYAQLTFFGNRTDSTLLAQVLKEKFPRFILQKMYKNAKKVLQGSEMLAAIGETLRQEAIVEKLYQDNHSEHRKGSYQKSPTIRSRCTLTSTMAKTRRNAAFAMKGI
ncbi:unnamed protein product [Bursaphelenchus okinawaensis]|uniref:Uncharacterized protein n=1 Tax=Bursaphelenchus okinawaensis TaxID=465554 RepID=A0A811KT82_9BILA|nr:unnamed protein product [Bursaphelenchus okinawaensis]CAG9110876.1 unnamed protein product [Bursaphelenchus okinawaensis]